MYTYIYHSSIYMYIYIYMHIDICVYIYINLSQHDMHKLSKCRTQKITKMMMIAFITTLAEIK